MEIVSNITYEQAKKDYEDTLDFYVNKTREKVIFGALDEARVGYKTAQPALFSNENNHYIEAQGIPRNASAFVIGSSYDNVLDLVGLGAKNIYSIDINQKQFYIDCLKLWSAYYLTYEEFFYFLVNPHTERFLNEKTMHYILSKVPESPASMYWFLIYDRGGKDFLQNWVLMDEKSRKESHSGRTIYYLYIKNKLFYEELREKISEVCFQFQTSDILDVGNLGLIKNSFDCILLSNVHNFIDPYQFYSIVIDKMMPFLKKNGWISYYEIKRYSKWFLDIKQGKMPNIFAEEILNLTGGSPKFQLEMSFILFQLFQIRGFDPMIYSMQSGGGFPSIQSNEDSAIVIKKSR